MKKTIICLTLMIISSFFGAFFSSFFIPDKVEAQIDMEILQAKGFILSDETGNTRAFLSMKEGQPILGFYDDYGNKSLVH